VPLQRISLFIPLVARFSALLCLLVLMAGCMGAIYRSGTIPGWEGVPPRTELVSVPFHPQKQYQCGPAALASALESSGCEVSPEEISSEVYTPNLEGSLQSLLLSAVRSRNRLPYLIDTFEALIRETAAGHPVVVLQNLSLGFYPIWHYAVVIGYDRDRRLIILRSGEVPRMEKGWGIFQKTWARAENWGLAVFPLDELPASADEASYLEAATAFEDIGKWSNAAVAYRTALTRWPSSFRAYMGLGNSFYMMDELEQANTAFRKATVLCPACGDAFNNLAQVQADQGQPGKATESVLEAIRLGGPNRSIYLETLEEIRRREKIEQRGPDY